MTDDITVQINGGVSKYTDESIRDLIAAFVSGGTDVDITHDDSGDVLTFNFTGTSYTAEAAQDDIAAALDGSSGISVSYDDPNDTITIDTDALRDGDSFDGQGTSELSNVSSIDTERGSFKEKPHYDVTSWGATGDGSTDDSGAIQDAIDAATTDGGGALFFPEPETGYLIETPLTPKDNVWYQGEAWPRLMAGDLGNNSMFQNLNGLSNARWTGLELDGSTGWTSVGSYSYSHKAIFLTPSAEDAGDLRDVVIQNCYVHDTPATALGIDSCINDWYLYNRVVGAGTDGETQGSNGIGVGVSEEIRAPTYIIGNEIRDTAEHAITLEQTGGSQVTRGPHFIAGNYLYDAKVNIWLEQSRGVTVCGNTHHSATRTQDGLRITDGDGVAAKHVTVTGETFLGSSYDGQVIEVGPNADAVTISSFTIQSGGRYPFISTDNVLVNGVGKTSAGVAGAPTASDWDFSSPCHVRNTDDETLWRVQFGTVEQLSYGEPVDLTAGVTGTNDGQGNVHDGTGTPPFGLCLWDDGNSQWVSQVDGSTFT